MRLKTSSASEETGVASVPRCEQPLDVMLKFHLGRTDLVATVLSIIDKGILDAIERSCHRSDNSEPFVVDPRVRERHPDIS
jgi:hypothetical protein